MKNIKKFIKTFCENLNSLLVKHGGDCKTFKGKPVKYFNDYKIKDVCGQAIALVPCGYFSGTGIPFSIRNHTMMKWCLLFDSAKEYSTISEDLKKFDEAMSTLFTEKFPKGKYIFGYEITKESDSHNDFIVTFNVNITFDDYNYWSR